jgi:hypothetical protein
MPEVTLSDVQEEAEALCALWRLRSNCQKMRPAVRFTKAMDSRNKSSRRAMARAVGSIYIDCCHNIIRLPKHFRMGVLLHEIAHFSGIANELQADTVLKRLFPDAKYCYKRARYRLANRRYVSAPFIQCVDKEWASVVV